MACKYRNSATPITQEAWTSAIMALSKSTRILILIGVNLAFFLLELIVGSAVHSLALVADAFHMLNDVISLCVGLWAVKAANSNESSKMYTYGWQRAEILGGLVNGVFLVALCLSIFLEAIQRFVEPQVVTNPMLVMIVGCCGFGFNLIGLFLFHNHSHSHGSHGHSHGHEHGAVDQVAAAEEGIHNGQVLGKDQETQAVADENGNVADVLPQSAVAGWLTPLGPEGSARESSSEQSKSQTQGYTRSDEDDSTVANSTPTPLSLRKSNASSAQRRHRRRQNSGGSRSRFSSIDDLNIHPASFRNDIIAASRLDDIASQAGSGSDGEEEAVTEPSTPNEESPLVKARTPSNYLATNGHINAHSPEEDRLHAEHRHSKQNEPESGGAHSHSDLNMRGVFLHVMGDALGNIGVIVSALIIWLTTWPGRYYADPAISLVITLVILTSAIPLCKAASKILLQAVPVGIDVDDIKDDIEEIPGIISCHHLHVWQLSNVKYVASLHVQLEVEFRGEGTKGYMKIANNIRHCLNAYGIKSSTIQPEFCHEPGHDHKQLKSTKNDASSSPSSDHEGGSSGAGMGTPRPKSKNGSKTASLRNEASVTCLLDCGNECGEDGQCCRVRPHRGGPGGTGGGGTGGTSGDST